MGVIIKYQLEFPEIGLTVSNDVMGGEFILDGDITATMCHGLAGSSFTIKLFDLPLEKAKELDGILQKEKLARVIIKLGYLDGQFEEIMEGVFTRIHAKPEGDTLVTFMEGLETATHLLKETAFQNNLPGAKSIEDVVKFILKEAKFSEKEIAQQSRLNNVSCDLKDKVLRGENMLKVLDELAKCAQAELLIRDKKVWLGKPITDDSYPPLMLQPDVNLAAFEPFTKDIPEEADRNLLRPLEKTKAQGFRFTITGDPKLRPGHKVVAAVEGYDKLSTEFLVYSLVHKLSTTGGYVCEGKALKINADENSRRRAAAACRASAAKVAEQLTQNIQTEQRHRPSVEIGKVKTYISGESTSDEKHLSTLYFGQRFERNELQPSIRADVETKEEQLFRNKPIVSPFAWHKCGLVVPVYPGMKALLSHNLNLQDDALVTGFLWSEQPVIEPPKNKEGDWWLCLPIDFETSKPPSDNTKAANDLITNDGKRVIEVKGLKITVGKDKLRNVGKRPTEGEDDEFLIEHKSGTTFKIASDGVLRIEAKNISIKGDVTIEGNVLVK